MIKVDISNVWGQLSLPDLLATEKEVAAAHAALTDHTGAGSDFHGWLDLPTTQETPEMHRIQEAADRIRANSDVFIVIGIGGSYLGPRAAFELLQGCNHNLGKDFSIAIISKSGTTTEPAIATRALRWMLERKYGTDGAKKRIYAITDPCKGALRQMAEEEGWETFVIPPDVGGRFSVLSPVGLLPMAVAGIDIRQVMAGAAEAKETYNLRSFENPVWLYAATRNLLYRNGKVMEIFESYEPSFKMFGGWWQQLFGESEGKDGKGIFPVSAEFTADLHSLGQMIQHGERNMFETMVRFAPPEHRYTIGGDYKNLDGLNYLEGKTLDFVDEQAFRGTVAAHVDGGVPVMVMDCGELNDAKVGERFYFLELCCGVSAYMLGVNPFNHPGVEFYKRNMFHLLGKPGYEN